MFEYFMYFAILSIAVGMFGMFMNRRSFIVMLMSMELLFMSAIGIIIISAHLANDVNGIVFALLALAIAAADTAVGITVLIAFFKKSDTTIIDKIAMLHTEPSGNMDSMVSKNASMQGAELDMPEENMHNAKYKSSILHASKRAGNTLKNNPSGQGGM